MVDHDKFNAFIIDEADQYIFERGSTVDISKHKLVGF